MGRHHHGDPTWPVRVDDEHGRPRGAGILLDDRHVLTSAHAVIGAGAAPGGSAVRVRVTSLACRPQWSRSARVAPGSWVHLAGTRRRDVALLRLDEPADCGITTMLRRAPVSGGTVRVHGVPEHASRPVPVDAELAGNDDREAEGCLLKPLAPGTPWTGGGYSGAAVTALDGAFAGRVIGIMVGGQTAGGTDGSDETDGSDGSGGTNATDGTETAWMLPTETIEHYLRSQITPFVDGVHATLLGTPGGAVRGDALGNSLPRALTRELARLLDGSWSGSAVVVTGDTTEAAAAWLVRLVNTADPAARAALPDGVLSAAPPGTALGLGAVDGAYDARNKSVADVRAYLVGRFGLSGGSDRDVYLQLLRRRPPARLVVSGVDRAENPDALVRRLLGPLAARARARGLRLVLGFADRPPARLPRDVFLDPEPLPGPAARPVTAAEAEEAVRRLAEQEDAAILTQSTWGGTFYQAPALPPSAAPRLRVRLAVARETDPCPELAAIHAAAGAAEAAVARFAQAMRQMVGLHENLTADLELYRREAAEQLPDEDLRLGADYTRAARELHTAPVHIGRAKLLVNRYIDEVNRRIDETGNRAVERTGEVDGARHRADTGNGPTGEANRPGDGEIGQADAAGGRADPAGDRGGAASGPADGEHGRSDRAGRGNDGG